MFTVVHANKRVTRLSPTKYICDASSINLPPGVWPSTIKVEYGVNCFIFHKFHTYYDKDLTHVDYLTNSGIRLRVFND